MGTQLSEKHVDPVLVKQSVLTFDLGYYNPGRFMKPKEDGIRFVTRIKKNASYVVEKEYAHSKIIRFRNGLTLRLVSITIEGKQRLCHIYHGHARYLHTQHIPTEMVN